MRKTLRPLGVLAVAVLVIYIAVVTLRAVVFSRTLSYEDVVSRGGMAVGDPVQVADDRWFLPIRFDVSGRRSVTVEPGHIDSMGSIAGVGLERDGDSISISIKMSTFPIELKQRECYGVYLKGDLRGDYVVSYQSESGSRHELRRITVREAYPIIGSRVPR